MYKAITDVSTLSLGLVKKGTTIKQEQYENLTLDEAIYFEAILIYDDEDDIELWV